MASVSKSAKLRFILANKDITPPEGWQDIALSVGFVDDEPQGAINVDELVFVQDGRQIILDHIAKGISSGVGIFEGIQLDIQAFNNQGAEFVFRGHVATYEGVVDDPENDRIKAKIIENDDKTNLFNRIEALSFGTMLEDGEITEADYVDVDYDIVPILQIQDLILSAILIYLMTKALIEAIEKTAQDIANIAGLSSTAVSGTVGATVYAVAIAVVRAAYAAAILIAITNLALQFLDAVLPINRTHKGIKLKTLLSKVATHLGLGFNSSIDDLETFTYLPSNPNQDTLTSAGFIQIAGSIKVGIPRPSDYGYMATETFNLCRQMFKARFSIINGVLEFHALNSTFWVKQSMYKMPSVLENTTRWNTDEFKANILVAFDTDLADEYTITQFTGTNYEIITTPKTVNKQKNVSNKGLEVVNIPVCLGNRKDKLTALERAAAGVASILDDAINFFGGNSNYSGSIKARAGVMKVSSNNHSRPKVLAVSNGKILANNRDILSAKALWDKYINYDSFVENGFQRQRIYKENVIIPFGLDDYNLVKNNSYFTDQNGKTSKIVSIEWGLTSDKAAISYWTSSPYTTNLKETKIEG